GGRSSRRVQPGPDGGPPPAGAADYPPGGREAADRPAVAGAGGPADRGADRGTGRGFAPAGRQLCPLRVLAGPPQRAAIGAGGPPPAPGPRRPGLPPAGPPPPDPP